MGHSDRTVGAMLSEIHGLLHEAKANVEIDLGKGQNLIDRVSAAETADKSGALTKMELSALISAVGEGIKASIEKEMSIENPDAAVIQVRALLDQLQAIKQ